jgi:hypothetical protein
MLTLGVLVLAAGFSFGGMFGAPHAHAAPSPLLRDLTRVDDLSEMVADGETAGVTAQHSLVDVRRLWPSVRTRLAARGANPALLHQADARIAALAGLPDARRANEATGALVPLFPLAGERMPNALHELDYLQRSLRLDVAANQWRRATDDASLLRRSWLRVRPTLQARGGAALDSAVDRDVQRARDGVAARNGAAVTRAAIRIGDEIDRAETALGA